MNELLMALWLLSCSRKEWEEQVVAAGKPVKDCTKEELLELNYYMSKSLAAAVTGLPPMLTEEEMAQMEKSIAMSIKFREGKNAKEASN